jgi:hypothetical protein
MTNWKEVSRLRRDPQAVRALARRLLKLPHIDWPEYQLQFLRDRAKKRDEREELTTRQAEFLLELRDESELHSAAGGFSIATLIEECWQHREPDRYRGLNEENVEFIERIRGKSALTMPQLRRLFACCRHLGLIEEYIEVDAA